MTLVVRVRNVGKQAVKFRYYPLFLPESTPAVLDEKGTPVSLRGSLRVTRMFDTPEEVNLAAGKEIDLHVRTLHRRRDPRTKTGRGNLFRPGSVRFGSKKVLGNTAEARVKLDPALEELATGKLELEVKEPVTAWGKEVGGLQAGLGLPAGAKRAYRLGETVTLVVRVRNVGKEAVEFEYVPQFLDENRPTVTTAAGTTLPQSGTAMMGIHGQTAVSLKPGEQVVLKTRMHGTAGSPHVLLPANGGDSGNKVWSLFVQTGTVGLRYGRVIGNSSSGFLNRMDPALGKLGTGTLELEVKEAK